MKNSKIIIGIVLFFLFVLIFVYKVNTNYLAKKVSFEIDIWYWQAFVNVVNRVCDKVRLNYIECKILKYQIEKSLPNYADIKFWYYKFSGASLKEVFQKFIKWPDMIYKKFTIIPGWTKFDIYNVLIGQVDIKIANRFLKLIDDTRFINEIKKSNSWLLDFWNIKSLEGFLYPDTYFFKPDDFKSLFFADLLIKTALKEFKNKVVNLFKKCEKDFSCNPYNLSPYEILIIASIVEKEEKNTANQPLVADILIRRYKNNWLLGADWTLCYWLKIKSNECSNYLYNQYLKDKTNPYNTRAVKGLPPTPVWNPTVDAIKAVLYPKKNNYWFYLHDCDWNIYFAKTFQEHTKNKAYVCK